MGRRKPARCNRVFSKQCHQQRQSVFDRPSVLLAQGTEHALRMGIQGPVQLVNRAGAVLGEDDEPTARICRIRPLGNQSARNHCVDRSGYPALLEHDPCAQFGERKGPRACEFGEEVALGIRGSTAIRDNPLSPCVQTSHLAQKLARARHGPRRFTC